MSQLRPVSDSISYTAYEQLIHISRKALPKEACGLLARGEASVNIDIVYPIRNIHDTPSRSFAFDPTEWISACYRMQKNRQSLVGFFHSHPHTAAVPSTRDKRGALHDSGLSYWIVSLKNHAEPVVQSYRIEQGNFIPLPLGRV